jgi:CheY-like chemotaxis protein
LATCYDIVQQHGGDICIDSKIGHGTTVRLYLPQISHVATLHPCSKPHSSPPGSETILLAEDESTVRTTTARLLRDLGYRVLEASNGDDALGVARAHHGVIDLLLADIFMPCMGGQALGERLAVLRPGIRMLLMSGYAGAATSHLGAPGSNIAFIQKPFLPAQMARKVRDVLDA